MGTKAAPGFANCFMGDFEEQFVYPYKLQPLKYLRFLDDCFLIWQHGLPELELFVTHMNTRKESIKFTMEVSKNHVNFLDTTVRINHSTHTLETDLFCKPTDSHNYLLYNSAHPRKCKDSIPYSQFLRIRRICTNTSDYDRHIITLSQHFLRQGYPLDLLEIAAIKARRLDRNMLLSPKHDSAIDAEQVVLVTTFEPSQDTLRTLVKENWDYLGKSPITTFIHQKKIMVGYRRPKNLRDLLVKADCSLPKPTCPTKPRSTTERDKFLHGTTTTEDPTRRKETKQKSLLDYVQTHNNLPTLLLSSSSAGNLTSRDTMQPPRSTSLTSLIPSNLVRNKCAARTVCHYCPLLNTSGTIKCHVTGKIFKTMKNITCRSSNLIYCITCKKCDMQYVGQTGRSILERFQGHCGKIKKYRTRRREEPILFRQQDKDGVGTHFSADNHNGTQDLIISVLAFISLPPKSQCALIYRLKVEKEWIHRMRCPAPLGLNIFD